MLATTRSLLVAAALTLALSLAACGSDSDSGSGSKSDANTIGGNGYAFALPDGWKRGESTVGEELRLSASEKGGGEAAVTVSRTTTPPEGASLDALANEIRQRLLTNVPGLSSSALSKPHPIKLGGETARAYEADTTIQGKKASIRGLVTLRDGAAYTVVFAAPGSEDDTRKQDYQSMLDSWEWKEAKAEGGADPSADAPAQDGLAADVKPAQGAPVDGKGYGYKLPQGWREVKSTKPPPGVEAPEGFVPPDTLTAGEAFDGIPVTATVTVLPDSGSDLEAFANGKGSRYFGLGAKPAGTAIAGVPAIAGVRNLKGLKNEPIRVEDIVALKDGTAYVVEFTAPPEQFDEQSAIFNTALASWTWK